MRMANGSGSRGVRSLTFAMIAALVGHSTVGCAPRLNHFHSDVDQKLADTAVTNFRAVTEDSNIYAQRRNNLKVEAEFRRVLASKWIFNTDERNLTTLYGQAWTTLVADIASKVGVASLNELETKIPEVRAKLGAIADTLDALGAAEAVIQKESFSRESQLLKERSTPWILPASRRTQTRRHLQLLNNYALSS